MNRLREKFHMPKAQSLHENGNSNSLEAMVRDSFYLAWPMANMRTPQPKSANRGYLRKSAAVDEDDSDLDR